MKNTLIALLALGGVALAEEQSFSNTDYTFDDPFDLTQDWTLTFNAPIDTTNGSLGLIKLGEYVTVDAGPIDQNSSTAQIKFYVNNTEHEHFDILSSSPELEPYLFAGYGRSCWTLTYSSEGSTLSVDMTSEFMDSVGVVLAGYKLEDVSFTSPAALSGITSSSGTFDGKFTGTVASVPEPTTATLSLLALAGLAARRRRK